MIDSVVCTDFITTKTICQEYLGVTHKGVTTKSIWQVCIVWIGTVEVVMSRAVSIIVSHSKWLEAKVALQGFSRWLLTKPRIDQQVGHAQIISDLIWIIDFIQMIQLIQFYKVQIGSNNLRHMKYQSRSVIFSISTYVCTIYLELPNLMIQFDVLIHIRVSIWLKDLTALSSN